MEKRKRPNLWSDFGHGSRVEDSPTPAGEAVWVRERDLVQNSQQKSDKTERAARRGAGKGPEMIAFAGGY